MFVWLYNVIYIAIGRGRCYSLATGIINICAAALTFIWFFYYYFADMKSGEYDVYSTPYKLRMAYAIIAAIHFIFVSLSGLL